MTLRLFRQRFNDNCLCQSAPKAMGERLYIQRSVRVFADTRFSGRLQRNGLLGGRQSGAAWLFSFWHIMFPLAVIAYVLLKDTNETAEKARAGAGYRDHDSLRESC